MTYEQFCFWLSGYLSGMSHDVNERSLDEVLSEELTKVHKPGSSQGILFQGCHP